MGGISQGLGKFEKLQLKMVLHSSSLKMAEFLKVFAPAKINLHLEVLGLRKDGFHELAMLMQSISLYDEINLSHINVGCGIKKCAAATCIVYQLPTPYDTPTYLVGVEANHKAGAPQKHVHCPCSVCAHETISIGTHVTAAVKTHYRPRLISSVVVTTTTRKLLVFVIFAS